MNVLSAPFGRGATGAKAGKSMALCWDVQPKALLENDSIGHTTLHGAY